MFLAMVTHPDVQRKAQQELDMMIGPDRLPEFSDRDSLPYINAVVKEVIRWHSVVPLGVSHRVMEEDEYKGYRIPTGTILVPNAWYVSSRVWVVNILVSASHPQGYVARPTSLHGARCVCAGTVHEGRRVRLRRQGPREVSVWLRPQVCHGHLISLSRN